MTQAELDEFMQMLTSDTPPSTAGGHGGPPGGPSDPSSDDDITVDTWRYDRDNGRVIRIHRELRRRLYVPGDADRPVYLNSLRGARRTHLTNEQGVRVMIDDDWRAAGGVDVGYGRWTGRTVFTIKGYSTPGEEERMEYNPSDEDDHLDGNHSGEDDDADPHPEPSPGSGPRYSASRSQDDLSGTGPGTGSGGGSRAAGRAAVYSSPSTEARAAAGEYVRFVEEEFGNEPASWVTLIHKGNQLLQEAGSVEKAAESLWEVRESQGLMNLKGVECASLEGLLHPDLLDYLRSVRHYGMEARYVGPRKRVKAKLHPNAKRSVDQVFKQIAKDVKKHRALVVDGALEELEGTISSPFETVDKQMPDRTISTEKRLVHDQRGVNCGTSKFLHPPALQPVHSQVAQRVLWMKGRCPGLPVLMAKKDIAGAFRLLWLRPADVGLFAGDIPWVPEKAFGETYTKERPCAGDITILYLVSSFGFSGSPGEWSMWGRATEEFHRAHRPQEERRDMSVGFDAKVLVDDCILVEPWVGLRPWISSEVFETGVKQLLGKNAVNQEKDEIEGAFKTTQTVWGVIMQTDTEKALLPEKRIQKGAELMSHPGFDHGAVELTLKQLQQFRGIMTGWAAVIQGLANELKAADKFLAGKDGGAPIALKPRGDGSKRWEETTAWEDLWELFEVCRWLGARSEMWDELFTTSMRRMLQPLDRLSLPGEWEEVVFVSSDATPTMMGAIDWKSRTVFRESVKDLQPWIIKALTDEERDSEEGNLVIHLSEMLSFVAFACAMGPRWQGRVVIYGGDNMVVRNWLRSRQSRVRGGRLLIRVLNLVEMRWGCQVLAGWWRTFHNIDADFLTRCDDQEFALYVQEKNLEVVDVKGAVFQALEDSEKFGLTFIYQADEGDRIQLLKLKERRVKRQIQSDLAIPWECIRVDEWTPGGRLVKDFIDAAGLLGARVDGESTDGPGIFCATVGPDVQGRQLRKCLQAFEQRKAWVGMIEGPRLVAWELGERLCEERGWDGKIIEYVTTEHGEAMARRRKCLVIFARGGLAEGWAGYFVRPSFVAKMDFEGIYIYDRRGPPGHLRKLEAEEIWVLQGRSRRDFKLLVDEVGRDRARVEGCRATGAQTAANLLAGAGALVSKQIEAEAGRAGANADKDGAEALAQILMWLRRWRRKEFGLPTDGRRAGGRSEDSPVCRWAEAWWINMLEPEDPDEEPDLRRAGGKKKTAQEIAEIVAKQVIDKVGLQVRPFGGEVTERVEEWLEENMTGDKSAATERAYAGAWAKWCAWARRKGWLTEYLSKTEDVVGRENKLLAYVGYLGWLGCSVNTIRQATFAIKTAHKRIGEGDITEGMHRVWILLGGLDRRNTTRKPRRLGVTQEMIVWLGQHLVEPLKIQDGNPSYADALTIFAAISTAWFFMLRAKEYAESNGVDLEMIVRGCDIRLMHEGIGVRQGETEVSLQFRKTKTDQLAFGDTKVLKATGVPYLCPVEALSRMRKAWPDRFRQNHPESLLPLFRWASGGVVRRLEIQHLLQRAAAAVGLQGDRFMSHSLRIGGATALYQATSDIELVKRLGRWSSSAVHRYLEDGGTVAQSSERMAKARADLVERVNQVVEAQRQELQSSKAKHLHLQEAFEELRRALLAASLERRNGEECLVARLVHLEAALGDQVAAREEEQQRMARELMTTMGKLQEEIVQREEAVSKVTQQLAEQAAVLEDALHKESKVRNEALSQAVLPLHKGLKAAETVREDIEKNLALKIQQLSEEQQQEREERSRLLRDVAASLSKLQRMQAEEEELRSQENERLGSAVESMQEVSRSLRHSYEELQQRSQESSDQLRSMLSREATARQAKLEAFSSQLSNETQQREVSVKHLSGEIYAEVKAREEATSRDRRAMEEDVAKAVREHRRSREEEERKVQQRLLETSAQLAEEREQRLEQLRTERLRVEELREELQRRCKAFEQHSEKNVIALQRVEDWKSSAAKDGACDLLAETQRIENACRLAENKTLEVESSLRSEGAKRQALGATLREALEVAEAQRAEQMQMERQQREQLQMKQEELHKMLLERQKERLAEQCVEQLAQLKEQLAEDREDAARRDHWQGQKQLQLSQLSSAQAEQQQQGLAEAQQLRQHCEAKLREAQVAADELNQELLRLDQLRQGDQSALESQTRQARSANLGLEAAIGGLHEELQRESLQREEALKRLEAKLREAMQQAAVPAKQEMAHLQEQLQALEDSGRQRLAEETRRSKATMEKLSQQISALVEDVDGDLSGRTRVWPFGH
eukprot:s669_g9.t1